MKASIEAGAASIDDVARACRAGTGCGACLPQVAALLASCGRNCPASEVCQRVSDIEREIERSRDHATTDCPARDFQIPSPYLIAAGRAR